MALSSSFFGFFAHAGFADALYQTNHRPSKLTGSSAGALVAAGLASGLSIEQLKDLVFGARQQDFWDPGIGLGYLRGKKFRNHIAPHFAPTFSHTQIPLEVSVFDVFSMRTHHLKEGDVASAVVASCSVPLMFQPVRINGRLYVDGGILNKSGIHPSPDERILCVYLESSGTVGVYERKTSFPNLHKNHKIVRFTDFPRVSFNSLEKGRDAYQHIFSRTVKALDLPFVGNFLNV